MITQIHIPSPPLDQFIDHFVYFTEVSVEHSVERFLPDGDVQIIFDLTDFPKFIYDNDTLKEIQACQHVWFSGFRTEPITIPSGTESEMAIVQFKKGKAYPFLNQPMYQLTDYVVDAELVFDSEILNIREKLLSVSGPLQKLLILEESLLKYYLDQRKTNLYVDFAISSIIKAPNQNSISEISKKAGYSQKHIIKLFKEHVGVTPKDFLKIIRFQNAIRQIDLKVDVNWPAIAIDCGFYDQSHFIADFKSFSGYTPEQYLKMRGDVLNYIPILE